MGSNGFDRVLTSFPVSVNEFTGFYWVLLGLNGFEMG